MQTHKVLQMLPPAQQLDQILMSKLEAKPDNWNSIQIGFIGKPMAELAKRQEPA
jgi:hypothetical protein